MENSKVKPEEKANTQLEAEVNAKIDSLLKEGKDLETVEKEVKALYADVSPKKVFSVYDSRKEIESLVLEADQRRKDYEGKVAKINPDLKENKQEELKAKYEADFKQDLAHLQDDLKRIAKKDAKYRKEAKERNLLDAEYKEKRAEAFNVLLQLGKVLDEDLVEHLLRPLVEVEDLISIRILAATAGPKNKIAFNAAIRKVEQMQQLSDIDGFLREADKYISNGAGAKHLPLLLQMKRNK